MSIKLLASGGLGNQLAQYSAARALAIRRGTDLIIDTRFYPKASLGSAKGFWLTHFPICAKVVSYDNAHLSAHHPLRRLFRRALTERPSRRYLERSLRFDPAFLDLDDGATISGTFLCHSYFESDFDLFSKEVDLLESGRISRTEILNEQPLSEYIGIHVRRGDYISPETSRMFDVVDRDSYYSNALSLIRDIVGKRPLLVVSDDLAWCRRLVAVQLDQPEGSSDGGTTLLAPANRALWAATKRRKIRKAPADAGGLPAQ